MLDALRQRRFYATTGNRPLLDVHIVGAGGQSVPMGGVLADSGDLRLRIAVHGSAPLQEVQVRNGADPLETLRPFAGNAGGQRLKLSWGGAEVRGRDRLCCWDGELFIEGSRLTALQPVNFWNPDSQPEAGHDRVRWQSVTAGGDSGLILTLSDFDQARLHITTPHLQRSFALGELHGELRCACGGLGRHLTLLRLPDQDPSRTMEFEIPVSHLRPGDNPIWLRVTQLDGHQAWSSPIYVVRQQ